MCGFGLMLMGTKFLAYFICMKEYASIYFFMSFLHDELGFNSLLD
jgi:hypothetical protein